MATPPSSSALVVGIGSVGGGSGSNQQQQVNKSRFPRLQECAHFHYEVSTVDLPKNFKVIMLESITPAASASAAAVDESSALSSTSASSSNTQKPNVNAPAVTAATSTTAVSISSGTHGSASSSDSYLFHLQVSAANEKRWIIYRSYENFRYLDKYLHDCIFDRKFSCLDELKPLASADTSSTGTLSKASSSKKSGNATANNELINQLRSSLAAYLVRFSEIAFVNPINCGPILNWFEVRFN